VTDAPLDAVETFLDVFNAGDREAMSAAYTADGSIFGVAPHLWLRLSADWHRDVLAEGAHLGASGDYVTLGDPGHNDTTGEAAYVVVPATTTFDRNGTHITPTGATSTMVLRRGTEGSRVAAWACSKGRRAS
jgi:hypothetical protein